MKPAKRKTPAAPITPPKAAKAAAAARQPAASPASKPVSKAPAKPAPESRNLGSTKPAAKPAATTKPAAAAPPAAKSTARKPRTTSQPKRGAHPQPVVAMPGVLLEGDLPPRPAMSGPGRRYALGPEAPMGLLGAFAEPGELPVAYGTRRLIAAARDPHWIYVHWDLTDAQQREYNAESADGRLVIRVHRDALSPRAHAEVQVHPESRSWFVHVGVGGARFIAELGYYEHGREWVQVAASRPTLTPTDSPAEDEMPVQFATIPPELSFQQLLELIQTAVAESVPLAEAIEQLRASGHPDLPGPEGFQGRTWTPAQATALAEAVYLDQERRVWIGSLEITELLRRRLEHGISSAGLPAFSVPPGEAGAAEVVSSLSHVSSPHGKRPGRRDFWFNVNTELIVYGATEPNATVTIGGRPIRLRPDGTFSFRFSLPDGHHPLPVAAHSADGVETRSAQLQFSRATEYQGEVGAHPQDPKLKQPSPENVA